MQKDIYQTANSLRAREKRDDVEGMIELIEEEPSAYRLEREVKKVSRTLSQHRQIINRGHMLKNMSGDRKAVIIDMYLNNMIVISRNMVQVIEEVKKQEKKEKKALEGL